MDEIIEILKKTGTVDCLKHAVETLGYDEDGIKTVLMLNLSSNLEFADAFTNVAMDMCLEEIVKTLDLQKFDKKKREREVQSAANIVLNIFKTRKEGK